MTDNGERATPSAVSQRLRVVIAIVLAYVLTRVIYRTTGFPFTTLAEQPPAVRFGADVGMWLLICAGAYALLSMLVIWARPARSG